MERASNVPLGHALDAVRGALAPADALHFVMLLTLLRHEAERDTGERASLSRAGHAWNALLGQGLWRSDGYEVASTVMDGLGEWESRHRRLRDLSPDLRDVRGSELEPLVRCVDTAQKPASMLEACLEHVQRAAKGGDYYTPADIAALFAALMEPRPGERVYDPVCGSGGLLLKADEYMRGQGGRAGDMELYGQDSSRTAVETAAVNLTLHGVEGSVQGPASSLTDDRFENETFDVIVANPPFNQAGWSQGGRGLHRGWRYGIPPEGNANFAWVQHVVSKMSPAGSGRGVLLLPTAAASTSKSAELGIRTALVEDDVLSCVVELPAGLLPHVRNPATLWLFNGSKKPRPSWGSADRTGHVLLIDASDTAAKVGRGRRSLPHAATSRIIDTFATWRGVAGQEAYEDVPGWCRSLTTAQVSTVQDYDVLPSRHVGVPATEYEQADRDERVRDLTGELHSLFETSHRLEAELLDLLRQW